MKNLTLSLFFLVVLILFATVQGSVEQKEHQVHEKEEVHVTKVVTKKPHKATNTVAPKAHEKPKHENKKPKHEEKKEHKKVEKVAPEHKEKVAPKHKEKVVPKHKEVPKPEEKEFSNEVPKETPKHKEKEVPKEVPKVKPISVNINEKEEKEEKGGIFSENKGTITVVSLALVAAAAGGVTYRNKAKKQLGSPELFKYKFENNAIYDYTPKNSSLSYSFNASDFNNFREERPRLNFYEDPSIQGTKRNSGSLSTEVIYEDSTSDKNLNVVLPTNRAYKVVLPWDARCVDEIQLNIGDLVCIKECYQDGYSLGRNLTTRFDGIFPTCCLDNIGSSVNQAEVSKWQSVGMYSLPKRSVKPTKKAKRASRGISLLTIPDWTKKLESLKLDSPSPAANTIF
ncbi:hypothetical protein PIROE2DRAFT_21632 [Piromyces sp. E2]|nr:hypothetical protein PIROE2DRAFT_21632 [Piromyces sp. E2]|eukprot:OUM56263.1 hypothetical protein PIROE2DRAFT_21632 [Piromyces sp. E2]